MSKRVLPTERIRAQIDELFASETDLAAVLEQVGCPSVRLIMQAAVEAQVTEFLSRTWYERRDGESKSGSRNGWQPPAAIKTTMGPVELQRNVRSVQSTGRGGSSVSSRAPWRRARGRDT